MMSVYKNIIRDILTNIFTNTKSYQRNKRFETIFLKQKHLKIALFQWWKKIQKSFKYKYVFHLPKMLFADFVDRWAQKEKKSKPRMSDTYPPQPQHCPESLGPNLAKTRKSKVFTIYFQSICLLSFVYILAILINVM